MQVLEDAGVYKCTQEGRNAFMKFVAEVNKDQYKTETAQLKSCAVFMWCERFKVLDKLELVKYFLLDAVQYILVCRQALIEYGGYYYPKHIQCFEGCIS